MTDASELKVKKDKKDKKPKEEKKEKKETKRRRDDDDDEDDGRDKEPVTSKKRKVEVDDDVQPETRRRTRSMSEGEESFRKMLTPDEFRKLHTITITGRSADGVGTYVCPAPFVAFGDTPFAPPIRKCLDAAGFTNPTPTQAQAWPIACSGRDVITVARTGSGKTCGFLLPAMHRLMSHSTDRKRGSPAILVLAPTRELACQIEEEAVKFGRTSNMRSACCYGGAPKSIQIRKLQAGVEVLIATPGRLNDLIEMNIVNLSQVLFLVLDEADRMLDMGFEPQIRTIISKVPADRQSMMFTATWPREVQTLAREFLRNPVEVKFGDTNNLNANKAITQVIKVVSEHEKSDMLKQILSEINPGGEPEKVPKTIVFVSRKSSCDNLANDLWNANYAVDSLHGDKMQFMRTKVMDDFKKSNLRILVATGTID
jgi:ATP-dependent RNA helicase DDX5/DBP2